MLLTWDQGRKSSRSIINIPGVQHTNTPMIGQAGRTLLFNV
jgi:hypothetical protein